jgi:hypothetical protein
MATAIIIKTAKTGEIARKHLPKCFKQLAPYTSTYRQQLIKVFREKTFTYKQLNHTYKN